ncbi:MAG TPA: acyl-CoA dehydrogenase family protein [Alphaproteobacteria bacterium]|nr:acyl-CoA dehydrogenase family protein [Alphaproteobacteria bacterium]
MFNSPSVYFTDEHRMLRDQLRRFVESEIVPHGAKWEEDGKVPRDVLRRMGALGFLGLRHPVEYGGSGMDTLASVVLAEELGRSSFGGVSATVLVHTDMASPHIARFGTKAQHQRWMRKIIAGEAITAVAVTEPGAGSDVASMRTRAVRDGNHFVLNGTKMFITNGVHADLYFVAAKTDPAAKGSRGITMFIVEKGTPGFRIGQQLDKTGWLSSDTAELVFEDCRVDANAMLGEENKGFYAVMRNFQNERVTMGAMAMAEAGRAIEITLDYVKTRPAFGGTLWDKQAVRVKLAELAAKVEAGRQLVHHAAWLDAQGQDCVREVSMVKAYCGDLVNEVMYGCVQFHGGAGYMRGSVIERMARDARIQAIGGGATEVMLEEVAKRMDA